MAPPLATSHINTIRDPVNTSNNTQPDPPTDTPDWSILTETISYTTPPTADIHVEVSQSQVNDASLDGNSLACEPLTPPTDTHLFQPYEGVQARLSAQPPTMSLLMSAPPLSALFLNPPGTHLINQSILSHLTREVAQKHHSPMGRPSIYSLILEPLGVTSFTWSAIT